jgi:cyanate permease
MWCSKDPIEIFPPIQAAKGWNPEISVWTSLSIAQPVRWDPQQRRRT